MKKSPVACFSKNLLTVWAIALCCTACQNASHVMAADKSERTRPANATREQPTPPSFSSEYAVSVLYDQYQYQWGQFTAWLSSGMMQPHRTVFPK